MKNYLNLILVSLAGLLASEVSAEFEIADTLASAGSFVPEAIKTKANDILRREILFPLNFDAVRAFSRAPAMPIKERQFSCLLTSYESGNVAFQLLVKRVDSKEKVLFATGYVDLNKERVYFNDAKKGDYVLAKNYQKFIAALPRSQPSIKKVPAESSKTSKRSS